MLIIKESKNFINERKSSYQLAKVILRLRIKVRKTGWERRWHFRKIKISNHLNFRSKRILAICPLPMIFALLKTSRLIAKIPTFKFHFNERCNYFIHDYYSEQTIDCNERPIMQNATNLFIRLWETDNNISFE